MEPPSSGATRGRRSRAVPPRLARWTMNAVYGTLVVVLLPYALWRYGTDHKTRARWNGYARHLLARFGRRRRRTSGRPCVWVHGVSVGEVKATARLLDEIERAWPGVDVLVTVSTDTGLSVAEERYPGRRVEFYPPDLSWVVSGAVDALAPDLVVLVESEFWPNFLSVVHERTIPVVLVNGRLSERSLRRFERVRALARPLLAALAAACVQTPVYADRFRRLGLPPSRLRVTGNMKFDNIPRRTSAEDAERFRRLLGGQDGMRFLVGGSTHPDEELVLARIHAGLLARGVPLRLVVAPRHPARTPTIAAQLARHGHAHVRRSDLDESRPPPPGAIVLLDTVGELETVYAIADAVYVGGSLVPHGGQNMMEPASLGRPVVVGPHVSNFRGEVDMLVEAGGLVVAPDEAAVAATLTAWLEDPAHAAEVGRRAREAIDRSKGATARTLAVLAPWLDALAASSVSVREGGPGR